MAKLNNIRAIRQMLDGTHRMQTKKAVSFSESFDKEKYQKREVGDVWTDEKGVEWEQRAGFKIKKGKLDEIRDMLIANRMPATCPKCNQPMTKRLDEKFWKLEKRCFDCQIDFEHNLRIEGKFHEYERNRILQNAEAWLADAEKDAKEIIETFRNPLTFANADGTFEEWAGGKSAEEVAEQIEKEFNEFKTNFLEKLKTTEIQE